MGGMTPSPSSTFQVFMDKDTGAMPKGEGHQRQRQRSYIGLLGFRKKASEPSTHEALKAFGLKVKVKGFGVEDKALKPHRLKY